MREQPGRTAVALVLADTPDGAALGTRWQLRVDGAGTLHVPALGLQLTAQQLSAEEAADLAALPALATLPRPACLRLVPDVEVSGLERTAPWLDSVLPLPTADSLERADRVVTVRSAGLTSSGSARCGFRVGRQRFGHLLDPRTGWPVDVVSVVTVIARPPPPADALATVISVDGLDHPRVAALLAGTPAAALTVGADRRIKASPTWGDLVVSGLTTTG